MSFPAFLLLLRSLPLTGEPQDGYPSYVERAVLELTNEARCDPAAAGDGSWDPAGFQPVSPLNYSLRLSKAARFHAEHMRDAPCYQRDSCCALESRQGAVSCADEPCSDQYCAPSTCPGTSFEERIRMFGGVAPVAENIAEGYVDPEETFGRWINETADPPLERENIFRADFSEIGVGFARGGTCGAYTVSDMSGGGAVAATKIPSGAHFPEAAGEGREIAFRTIYFDLASGAPMMKEVVADGLCHDMTLFKGSPDNGAYLYKTPLLGAGCHRYYFLFKDAGGSRTTYPGAGSLTVAVGASCEEDWTGIQDAADCETSCKDGEKRPCYSGPQDTLGAGECRQGTQNCAGGTWGACAGEITPSHEECDGKDNDCDNATDVGCGCPDGEVRECYSGSEETKGKGECKPGRQTCSGRVWGACEGEKGPSFEECDKKDNDCDGETDEEKICEGKEDLSGGLSGGCNCAQAAAAAWMLAMVPILLTAVAIRTRIIKRT